MEGRLKTLGNANVCTITDGISSENWTRGSENWTEYRSYRIYRTFFFFYSPPPSLWLAASALRFSSRSTALRESLILLPSRPMHFTRICCPSFSSSRTSFTRRSAISEMCNKPSVPGKISTNAPKSTMRETVPRYVCPTSASAVKPRIRFTAASAASPLAVAIEIVPSSATSIFAPVSSTSERMTLPPGPMTSRILSGLILIWMMRGANADLDRAVVSNIDLRAGLFNQRTNDFTAWSNDVANLVGIDLNLDDAWCKRGDLLARLSERLLHHTQDVETSFLRLLQSLGHDLSVDAGDLDVHLQSGDAVARARDFEVHVAIVIFSARDVGQDRVLVAFHHESHRHASDRRFEGHTRIHQRERATANGGHRR